MRGVLLLKLETQENPKMLDIYVKQAWHSVFCYACAYEEDHRNGNKKLLAAIVSGADSAIQSVRAVVDIGTRGGVRFGHGVKGDKDYRFISEYELFTEKGMYEKFPMSLNNSRKGLIIVHEDALMNGKYLLSFEDDPAQDVAKFLGGAPFGLRIEPDWAETVYKELLRQDLLRQMEFYKDEQLFNAAEGSGLHLFEVNMTEDEADSFVSQLLKDGKIRFAQDGTGEKLKGIEDLARYALEYNGALIDKLANEVEPTHDASIMTTHSKFETYPRPLFPVQAHASTAIAKRLQKQKAVILQGEMSTGKSTMMTAIADGTFNRTTLENSLKGSKGYHVCLMCPPSLMDKWPKEIRAIIPDADVHVIRHTEQLIRYHTDWTAKGRPKPHKPVFFIIAFTTMRDGARIEAAVTYQYKATTKQKEEEGAAYKQGFYCSCCGQPHQSIEDVEKYVDEDGVECEKDITYNMTKLEFGSSRRLTKTKYDPNAFCYHCGESLWTNKVGTRYSTFKEWASYERNLVKPIREGDQIGIEMVRNSQPAVKGKRGYVRKVAAIEYIRRKMKNFFDMSIIDEVHMCKGGNTAQGNSLGSLAAVSKKVIAGTGTLFGGKSMDIYYLLWRLFPTDMVKSGYKFEEVTRFNQEFGNVEKKTFVSYETKENSNSNSRGGVQRYPDKLLPGISPFIFGKYMLNNVVNVRLVDVWPDPVELIDTPTIFVPMSTELRRNYDSMISTFESHINASKNPGPLYRVMMDYGIAMPDNPFTIPDATLKLPEGDRAVLWSANHLDEDVTLPKEQKLQEIIGTEISEGRKSIVYVRDTGSTNPERDVRPRLKKKLEEIGAKVCILDTTSADTDKRSQWLEQKIVNENYDVCIVSQELVKVGLDLLCTPTIVFYQFSWSLFTINQAAKRSWRIGQTEECRLFYLAYEDCMQQHMAQIIAMKNKATAAINGELSSDGLSAMLGDEGDLRSLLLKSVKEGGQPLKGSTEEWISQTTDRAREILAGIGKKKAPVIKPLIEQFKAWCTQEDLTEKLQEQYTSLTTTIEKCTIPGFSVENGVLTVDYIKAFGVERPFIDDNVISEYLMSHIETDGDLASHSEVTVAAEKVPPKQNRQVRAEKPSPSNLIVLKETKKTPKKGKKNTSEEQLIFDLFA